MELTEKMMRWNLCRVSVRERFSSNVLASVSWLSTHSTVVGSLTYLRYSAELQHSYAAQTCHHHHSCPFIRPVAKQSSAVASDTWSPWSAALRQTGTGNRTSWVLGQQSTSATGRLRVYLRLQTTFRCNRQYKKSRANTLDSFSTARSYSTFHSPEFPFIRKYPTLAIYQPMYPDCLP